MSDHRDRAVVELDEHSEVVGRSCPLQPRNSKLISYGCKLTSVSLVGFSALVFLICGAFGFGVSCGTDGPGTTPSSRSRLSVLRAAPLSARPLMESVQSSHLNWPPAYVNTTSLNTQPLQLIPSKLWTPPWKRFASVVALRAGTLGSAPNSRKLPWSAEACTTVDLWIPKVQSTPSTNESSDAATAFLLITPPSSGEAGNCTIWKYREGEAPKPKRIIRPKKTETRI
jgi:hypothetical protein